MITIDLYKSIKPDKKIMIKFINPNTKRENTIHFGQAGADDYTITKNPIQKDRYILRHSGMGEDWEKSGIYSAGFWSRYLLWNKPSIIESIKDIENKFKIKINNYIDNPLNEKHSAYRSMKLSKLGLSKPVNKKNKDNLLRWTRENWINLNALVDKGIELPCGTKYKNQLSPTVCRPSIKISDKTPKIASEFTEKQIRKAIEIKKSNNRVNWKDL